MDGLQVMNQPVYDDRLKSCVLPNNVDMAELWIVLLLQEFQSVISPSQ